jgi:pimeloyl-ACP methyl ester carboxylesterase
MSSRHADPTISDIDRLRARILDRIPLEERRRELAGISTAYLEAGDGPPMVLLHGQGEFCGVWMRVVDDLVATHRVVVPDLPGHGASGLPNGPLDADRVLQWVEALIEETCPTPPVLVGHLLGGAIATRFTVEHEDRVDRLVLVDGLGLAPYRPSPRFALPMIGFMVRQTEGSFERMFRRCFVDLDELRDDMAGDIELVEQYALACGQTPELKRALHALMPAFAMKPIPVHDLDRITVPTSLIWGREDIQVRLEVAEAASLRHGWPLHVVDDAADDPAFERPRDFLVVLRVALNTTTHEEATP